MTGPDGPRAENAAAPTSPAGSSPARSSPAHAAEDAMLPEDLELLAALGAAWDQVDPVPATVLEAARGAFAWRDIDAELAELVLDTRLEEAAVRSVDGPRLLTFEAGGLTVEVEVAVTSGGRSIVGQLVPPQAATVTIRCNGPDRVVDADALGRFSATAVPPGPVSMLCRASTGGVAHATSWITI